MSHFSVSPKLNAQGDPLPRRLNVKALQAFAELAAIDRACFKVVAQTSQDVDHTAHVFDTLGVDPEDVWIMPQGVDGATLLNRARSIAPAVQSYGFNLSLRQQVLMYGNERFR